MNSNADLLAEVRKLDAEATPGGWLASEYLDDGRIGILTDSNGIVVALRSGVATKQDAAFIARARMLLPQLADALAGAEAEAASYKAWAGKLLASLTTAEARLVKVHELATIRGITCIHPGRQGYDVYCRLHPDETWHDGDSEARAPNCPARPTEDA